MWMAKSSSEYDENLTELRELYIDNVDFSGLRTKWCETLSFLPNLQVLDLSRSLLSGPINHHLANLRSLSVIRLRDNHAVSCQVPEFVANLLNLTTLDLSQCDLHGKIPKKGSLPHFPKNSSLRNLNLKNTSFSGTLPDSIGNLENLASVDVSSCNFTRLIPTSMANLTQLFHLDFSSNHFSGRIPTLRLYMSRNLNYLNLSSNDLTGGISSIFFEFRNLETLDLSSNKFSRLRLALSKPRVIPNLTNLDLSNNQIFGEVPNWIWEVNSGQFYTLNLSHNLLESLQEPYSIPGIGLLDLHSHQHVTKYFLRGLLQQ
ncbi:receptor-like protein 34 [Citrus sinensis]|uniref:receptor-like protein 34 n=1 Tax=Citrus sinensis TaxID=2711 RepID=UPI002278EE9B|nr:receptor-like protein 34 [Citrus sinensis]